MSQEELNELGSLMGVQESITVDYKSEKHLMDA